MTVWLAATLSTLAVCATLFWAANRASSLPAAPDPRVAHLQGRLRAIDADQSEGRIGAAEATTAKAELAREAARVKAAPDAVLGPGTLPIWLPLILIAAIAGGGYFWLGRPDLAVMPLANRVVAADDLERAVEAIALRLAENPKDLRGWRAIAPAYMRLGRHDEAAAAFRAVNDLAPPSADDLTNLAEALTMAAGGSVQGEPLALLEAATAADPRHARSRYYLAGELTRAGDFEGAIVAWKDLLSMAKGDESWIRAAQHGLDYAQNALNPPDDAVEIPDGLAIAAMVDGLDARLSSEGGSIDEWTQLVRSRLVQARPDDAQLAYDRARAAYPDPAARVALDKLAADGGLTTR